MHKYRSNAQVIHAWAHQLSDTGTNPNGSIFFDKGVIYSYGTHFPMARLVPDFGVLVTTNTWSRTTAKHMNWVRQAVSHLTELEVADPTDPLGPEAIEDTLTAFYELINQACRRKSMALREYDITAAGQLMGALTQVAAHKGFAAAWKATPKEVKRRVMAAKALLADVKIDAARAFAGLSERQKKRAEKEAKENLRRCKAQVAEAENDLETWLQGVPRTPGALYGVKNILGYDGLRLTPDGTVQTTQGLTVPAADCLRAWPLIKRAYRTDREEPVEVSELTRIKLGDFRLTRIEPDGTVVVGCHRFPRRLVERLAAQLEGAV